MTLEEERDMYKHENERLWAELDRLLKAIESLKHYEEHIYDEPHWAMDYREAS